LLLNTDGLKSFDLPGKPDGQYALANPGKSYVLYNGSTAAIKLDLTGISGNYTVKRINPGTGAVVKEEKIKAGSAIEFNKLSSGDEIVFINKN
jgi:hypothetical protein